MYIGRYHHLQRWTHLNNHFTGFIPWLFIQYSDCHDLSTYWCVDFFSGAILYISHHNTWYIKTYSAKNCQNWQKCCR